MGPRRWHERCERREQSPPHRAKSEDLARTKTIGQTPARRLEERVAQHERAEHPSELDVVQLEFALDGTSCDGNVYAVEESDGTDDEHPEDQKPAQLAAEDGHGELADASYHCPGMEVFDKMAPI